MNFFYNKNNIYKYFPSSCYPIKLTIVLN